MSLLIKPALCPRLVLGMRRRRIAPLLAAAAGQAFPFSLLLLAGINNK